MRAFHRRLNKKRLANEEEACHAQRERETEREIQSESKRERACLSEGIHREREREFGFGVSPGFSSVIRCSWIGLGV